ncbi:MAG: hypothetical protein ACLP50_09435 [Solirubrobacteraceae bacterium]
MSEPRPSWWGEVAAGSVVLLSALEGDELLPAVVRRVTEDAVTVVPVSGEVHMATEWDLLLGREVLGYAAMVRVWNFGTVLPEQIVDVAAVLGEHEHVALNALAQAARSGGEVPAGVQAGPATLDDADPRLVHQDADADLVHRFWAPALALAGAETLGQLVNHRREELRVAVAELESVTGQRGWLPDLEADQLDLRRTLPAGALAALLRRLRLGASRRLARIATWTIEAQAPTFARRGLEPEDGDVPSTSEYVAAMLRELEGD